MMHNVSVAICYVERISSVIVCNKISRSFRDRWTLLKEELPQWCISIPFNFFFSFCSCSVTLITFPLNQCLGYQKRRGIGISKFHHGIHRILVSVFMQSTGLTVKTFLSTCYQWRLKVWEKENNQSLVQYSWFPSKIPPLLFFYMPATVKGEFGCSSRWRDSDYNVLRLMSMPDSALA